MVWCVIVGQGWALLSLPWYGVVWDGVAGLSLALVADSCVGSEVEYCMQANNTCHAVRQLQMADAEAQPQYSAM